MKKDHNDHNLVSSTRARQEVIKKKSLTSTAALQRNTRPTSLSTQNTTQPERL